MRDFTMISTPTKDGESLIVSLGNNITLDYNGVTAVFTSDDLSFTVIDGQELFTADDLQVTDGSAKVNINAQIMTVERPRVHLRIKFDEQLNVLSIMCYSKDDDTVWDKYMPHFAYELTVKEQSAVSGEKTKVIKHQLNGFTLDTVYGRYASYVPLSEAAKEETTAWANYYQQQLELAIQSRLQSNADFRDAYSKDAGKTRRDFMLAWSKSGQSPKKEAFLAGWCKANAEK